MEVFALAQLLLGLLCNGSVESRWAFPKPLLPFCFFIRVTCLASYYTPMDKCCCKLPVVL